jgi:putative acetyltransferase
MLRLKKTDGTDKDFSYLIMKLDAELDNRYGTMQDFYSQFNSVNLIKNVVIAYDDNSPVGCGCFKQFEPGTVEIKRMFVDENYRGRGVAPMILSELENWAKGIGYKKAILQTGDKQPEAVRFYSKTGYVKSENYGQYVGDEGSVCMTKEI